MSSYNDRLTDIYKDLQSILASSGGSCPWTINDDETITFNQLNIYSDSMYGSVLTDTKGLWVNTPTLYFGSKGNPIFELNVDTNGLKLSQNDYLYLYDKTYKIGYEYVDGSHDKIHLGPLYYISNGYFYLSPVDLRITSSSIQWDDGLHISRDGAIYGYGSGNHEWHIDFPSNNYFQIYDTAPSSKHVLTSNGTHLAIGNPNGKVIILPSDVSSDGALENSGAFYFTTKGLYGGSANRWSITTDDDYNVIFNVYEDLHLTSSGGGFRGYVSIFGYQFWSSQFVIGARSIVHSLSGNDASIKFNSTSELVLTGIATPTADTDAANKAYVDAAIANLKAELQGG